MRCLRDRHGGHSSRARPVREECDHHGDHTSNARAALDDSAELETVLAVNPSEGVRRTRCRGGQAPQEEEAHGGAEKFKKLHCGLELLSVALSVTAIDGGECRQRWRWRLRVGL